MRQARYAVPGGVRDLARGERLEGVLAVLADRLLELCPALGLRACLSQIIG